MFPRSLSRLLIGCAAGVTLAAGTACAGEASQVAARGGFLVGRAYRCGASAEQLKPSTELVGEVIAALSVDDEEQAAADEIFVESLLTSLRAQDPDDRAASCTVIRRELAELEQHQRSRLHSGSYSDASEPSAPKPKTQNHLVRPARSKRAANEQPEELSPEQRAEIALKLAAQEQRRRPPSI